MKTYLTANITTKQATEGTATWQPPTYVFGETVTLALQFAQDINGNTVSPALDIRAVKAAIGDVDARPVAGRWALQVGSGPQTADNTTGLLQYHSTAVEVAAAINAKAAIVTAHGTAVVTKDDDTWSIIFGDGAASVPVKVVDNTLFPVSFGHVDAYPMDAVWRHELRLIQAPVAFTDAGERVLADAPIVTTRIEGQGAGVLRWNEVQELKIAANFTGSYRLKFIDDYTAQLSRADTADTIQEALAAAFGDNFAVTDGPELGTAFIEFVNDLAESDQPPITAEVVTAPVGDFTLSLVLDRPELAVRLRREATVTLPLEIRLQVADAEDNLSWRVVLRQEVSITRPVTWPDMALVPGIDWLRPPSPQSYKAFNASTVITGQQFVPFVIGDDVATVFPCAHGLDTNLVFVWVWENSDPGAELILGTDYTIERTNENSITVTALGAAPEADAWLVIVGSAQTVAAFAAGLEIEIDQVNGLAALLTGIQDTLNQFQALIPNVTPGAQAAGSSGGVTIVLPERKEIYPGVWKKETDLDDAKLKGKRLLPAIHDATVTSFTTLPLPSASAASGNVYQNNTAAVLVVDGGDVVPVGGYFGSDGQERYALSRSGNSSSFFPTRLERELWRIEISPEMLRTGKTLKVLADFAARTAGANADLQGVIAVEFGNIKSQSAPVGSAITLTTNGTGTNTLSRETGVVGNFTVVFGTGVFTIPGNDLVDGEVVTASNVGGALPAGMAVATSYVVRDKSGDTFKLALLTTAPNFEDIDWRIATPLLSHRLIIAPTSQPTSYGVTIARSASAITATRTLYGGELGVATAPPLARFALRGRLHNIDTRNPVALPRGLIAYESKGQATV